MAGQKALGRWLRRFGLSSRLRHLERLLHARRTPMSAASFHTDLPALVAQLRQHFNTVIVPLWLGRGFDAGLGLPCEALDAHGAPLPAQRYRAMACARQLYVFSRTDGAAAAAHAERLFSSLLRYFQNAAHGGWRHSVDAQGQPLDDTQDLYTHAFVVFACAAYFARTRDARARKTLLATVDVIEQRFRIRQGLYVAALSADWAQVVRGPAQNPVMHLTEAYLAAAGVVEPAWFAQTLGRLTQDVASTFLYAPRLCIAEEPLDQPPRFEPGHQFEWYSLLHGAPDLFGDLELGSALQRGCAWVRQHGVDAHSHGVAAVLDESGAVRDATQRIWAQTEYARYLALSGQWPELATQLRAFQARFLHQDGWHECLDAQGNVSRADMPSTTPYHLATCYAALEDALAGQG